ncbi:beta-lactamase regulator AmpE [Thalassotalea ganghwensis]
MSLMSLLIALAAQKSLSSSVWQFNFYFRHYQRLFDRYSVVGKLGTSTLANGIFILLPVLVCYLILSAPGDGILYFAASTLILIACFGCVATRDCYKQYLLAAFRGEQTTCELYHKQLIHDKNLVDLGFGQSLIWLNYRYFIAIMVFFVVFGAAGALAYRLLTKVTELPAHEQSAEEQNKSTEETPYEEVRTIAQQILFWLDWIPIRIVSFGYMLVGHFSKAMPTWLENLFDFEKPPQYLLAEVAHKSEDFMIDVGDCTAEPCLLVRLAKRTLLLCLAVLSILILTGVIH